MLEIKIGKRQENLSEKIQPFLDGEIHGLTTTTNDTLCARIPAPEYATAHSIQTLIYKSS